MDNDPPKSKKRPSIALFAQQLQTIDVEGGVLFFGFDAPFDEIGPSRQCQVSETLLSFVEEDRFVDVEIDR